MYASSFSVFTCMHLTERLVTMSTRGALVLADAIVLVVTWVKTFGHWREAQRLNLRVSISTCLLRDGNPPFRFVFHRFLTLRLPGQVHGTFCAYFYLALTTPV